MATKTVYHPVFPDQSHEVDSQSVKDWTDQGWTTEGPDSKAGKERAKQAAEIRAADQAAQGGGVNG